MLKTKEEQEMKTIKQEPMNVVVVKHIYHIQLSISI